MASPSPFTFVGRSNNVIVASGNLTLVTTGVTIATGDLVIACIAARGNAPFSAPDASWQLVAQEANGNTSTTASASIASGAMFVCESWPAVAPSLVFGRTGGDVASGVLLVHRGQKATGSLNAFSSATLAANSTTVATPSLTTTTADELLVAMVAGADNNNVSNFRAETDPTIGSGATDTADDPAVDAWIERFDVTTPTGADTQLGIGTAIKSAAGATGEIRATHAVSSRHVMIAASFKSAGADLSSEGVSKLSRYDVMAPDDDSISVSKLARYDVMMAVGVISITKFARYDILIGEVGPPPSTVKRRVQNVNYH